MKTKSTFISSFIAILAIAFAGIFALPNADAGDQACFAKAKGKYTGTLSGTASGLGISIPPSPASVKMPKGKGKAKVTISGLSADAKVTKAKCRQGGNKVIQQGTIKVPASATAGLGTVTGPFKSVIKKKSSDYSMKARTSFTALGVTISGVFKGTK